MRTMGYMPTEMELIELSQQINMNRKAATRTSAGSRVFAVEKAECLCLQSADMWTLRISWS